MRAGALAGAALLVMGSLVPVSSQTTAFVNVNVLPMDRERVLPEHTVLVRNGLIEEVAPLHRVQVPEGAQVIQGDSLFLMPALADMHVKLPSPQAAQEEVRDFFRLLLANNVATVRGMNGASNHLRIKREIASGALLGPTLYVGAPPLGGRNAQDPQGAIDLMLSYRSSGYDFLPMSGDIPRNVWDSLAEEAHSRGYTFGGTIPPQVGLRGALSSGISTVEHLDGYLEEVVADEVRARLERGEAVPLQAQLEAVEGRKMRAIAAHTRSSDSWVVPTMYLWENRLRTLDVDSVLDQHEMRYVPEFISQGWILEASTGDRPPAETAELMIEVRRRLLRALTMAGVGVLAGTGSPALFNVPGFSLRHELRSMRAAGLTPYEVLVTATRNVAEYARQELLENGEFGTVAEGNRADLILLKGNPLENLENLWSQEGMMVRGRWIPRSETDQWLQDMAERFGG